MKIKNVFWIGVLSLSLVGCGLPNNATVTLRPGSAVKNMLSEEEEVQEEPEASVTFAETGESLYIIEEFDMTGESITLHSIDDQRDVRYSYNLSTQFLDKYGDSSSWANFTVGTIVTIGSKLPSSGAISAIKMSDSVWTYEDVKKYSIDASNNVMTISGRNYKLLPYTMVYSDNDQITLEDISGSDVITVVGRDKEILSVSVTTGHGYMKLTNTELFDNSLIFIGNKIVTMVNGDNTLEIPEGSYKVTVANDGWGGSEEFTVVRNETTEVDLDSLKGDGPSFCEVSFLVTVPDTFVYIDGKLVDTDEPVEVRYGAHKLQVNCNGYNSWNKTLVVNSESATIALEMEESTTADSVEKKDIDSTQNSNGENNNNNTSNNSTNSSEKADENYDYETDYLSTLSNLLSNIMN